MIHKSIAQNIIGLKNADLALRSKLIEAKELGDGYNEDMKALHDRNAEALSEIIDSIGYPSMEKVGKEASEAAWLIIQHSIGKPAFMRKCATLMEKEIKDNNLKLKYYAYLTDRIAVFEGKPQLYGTQFDWDESGLLSPNRYDDLAKVNERRKGLGLNTLTEQTEIIRRQATEEHQSPPEDFKQRKMEFDEWRKQVGWIE